jgi:hypothetical protein
MRTFGEPRAELADTWMAVASTAMIEADLRGAEGVERFTVPLCSRRNRNKIGGETGESGACWFQPASGP